VHPRVQHVKTYGLIDAASSASEPELLWLLMTSANVSKGALGEFQVGGSQVCRSVHLSADCAHARTHALRASPQIKCQHAEVGVLIAPPPDTQRRRIVAAKRGAVTDDTIFVPVRVTVFCRRRAHLPASDARVRAQTPVDPRIATSGSQLFARRAGTTHWCWSVAYTQPDSRGRTWPGMNGK